MGFTISQRKPVKFSTQVPVAVIMALLGQGLDDSGEDDLGLSKGQAIYQTLSYLHQEMPLALATLCQNPKP